MALKVQSSFSTGELDPALHERTTLDKYKAGLATARNVVIGKTGRVVSRQGRKHFAAAKLQNRKVIIYGVPDTPFVLEWGHQYVRIYQIEVGALLADVAHTWTEDDLENIHFDSTVEYYGYDINFVYAFCNGKTPLKLSIDTTSSDYTMATGTGIFDMMPNPTSGTTAPSTTAPTGYDVEYIVTQVINGQESLALGGLTGAVPKLPIAANQFNIITAVVTPATTEMRVYRRPRNAGAYGYIGSTTAVTFSSPNYIATFNDNGQAADYLNSYPTPNPTLAAMGLTNPANLLPATGLFYQKRLLLGSGQRVESSRTGFYNNFFRDYPLSADSSLSFKAGSSGSARILRMIDSDGLVVFTTAGIFLNTGALGPTNISLDKRGNWVIDPRVPPIAIPGGVLFVDALTNVVRSLSYSEEKGSYTGDELSVFSDHLFTGNRIVSWAFHDGDMPVLYVVLDDGTFASFTYEPNHQMRAWTRHDSHRRVEYVASTGVANKTVFVTEADGWRYLEVTHPRYVSASKLSEDPDAHMGPEIAFMDGISSFKTVMNNLGGEFTFTPVVADDWEGQLTLDATAGVFNPGYYGTVGYVFRVFDPDDGSSVDLEVITRNSDTQVIVQPSVEFPSSLATGATLYLTQTQFTGLDHLEGEYPVVISDGYIICSPNNDDLEEAYPEIQVVGGVLNLPSGLRGAIVHIGLPIVGDVETLDIDTVEQRPTLIESQTVNKVYVKTHKTRGVYVGNTFPANNKVAGMISLDSINVDYSEENEVTGNRYQAPVSRRYEVSIPGDWASQGRICLRQVDPVHFEYLSIIPDLEDLRR